MTIEAVIGFEAVRNWWGRSLWDWGYQLRPSAIALYTYQIDLALAALLHIEHKRLFQASGRVGQSEESLVWSLRTLSIDGREQQLQGITCAQ
jgi:hypothetical protein